MDFNDLWSSHTLKDLWQDESDHNVITLHKYCRMRPAIGWQRRWLLIKFSVRRSFLEFMEEFDLLFHLKRNWAVRDGTELAGSVKSRQIPVSKPAPFWLQNLSCCLLPNKGTGADFCESWGFKRLSHVLFLTPFSFILFDSSKVIKPLHPFSLVASG